jgi:hypothetical protein
VSAPAGPVDRHRLRHVHLFAGIPLGHPQRWIAGSGAHTGAPPDATYEMEPLAGKRQAARTRAVVAARDPRAFIGALLRLADDTRAGRTVMPALIAAARAGTTAGEMAGVFRDAFGTFPGPAPCQPASTRSRRALPPGRPARAAAADAWPAPPADTGPAPPAGTGPAPPATAPGTPPIRLPAGRG